MRFDIQFEGATRVVEVTEAVGSAQVSVDGIALAADAVRIGPQTISILFEGRCNTFAWTLLDGGAIWLGVRGRELLAEVQDPRQALAHRKAEQSGRVRLKAPMAGKVVRLLAHAGDAVQCGQGVLVLEAMKMQNEVRAPKSGALVRLAVASGETVATGQLLAEIE
ncbi:MAG TPA: biotin/lipoyl-containing protein [Terriglobales bacterium]|nr:biotin/lipoyl-containing protein [Terriglobales bacterium]